MVRGNVMLADSIINLIIAYYQWHNTITKYYNYMKHLHRLCFHQFAFSLVAIGSWLMMSGYLICSRCQNKQTKKTTGFLPNNVPICFTVISVYDGKTVKKNPPKSIQPQSKTPARAPLQSQRLHISGDSLISWQELPLTQLQRGEVAIYSQSASIYPEDVNFPPCPGSLLEEMPKALKYSQSRTDYLPLAICATAIVFHPQSSATPKLWFCWSSTANSFCLLKTQQMDHCSQTCRSTFEGSYFFKKPGSPWGQHAAVLSLISQMCSFLDETIREIQPLII